MLKTFLQSAFSNICQQQSARNISWKGFVNVDRSLTSKCKSTFQLPESSKLSSVTRLQPSVKICIATFTRHYFVNASKHGLKQSTGFQNFHRTTVLSKLVCGPPKLLHQAVRGFRTSPKNDAVPPIIVIVLGRIAKFGAVIFGRTVRRWWQKLPPEERAKYARKVRRNRYITSGVLGGMVFGGFVYYETHAQVTPYTERRRFLAFNNAQIIAMSKLELEAQLQLHEKNIIPASAGTEVYRRIVRIAQQLLKGNEFVPQLQGLDWTVTVVNDDNIMNAFVLPCGSIFVFSGLLKLCDSDDQLGIILGHEMAHAVMGHGAEKASFLHLLDLLFVIPLAALWALLPTDLTAAVSHWITATLTEILMELPHSRFIEEEADKVGLILAAQSCFDIREAPVVWAKIALMEQDDISIEWLSTHPSHEKRQAQLEEMLTDALAHRDLCQCPRLPRLDPRNKIKAYQEGVKRFNKQRIENLAVPIKV